MDKPEPVELLAGHPLLRSFGEAELGTLASRGRFRFVEPPEAIFRQGEPADSLCLLLSGSASVVMRGERGFDHELARIESGGTLGELGLLGGGERAATVRALEPLDCFLLPSTELERLLDGREPAGIKLLGLLARTVAGRLRTMNARLCDLADDKKHPDGTVRLKLSDIRDRLLRAGAGGD